jgi:hypothetical protein
MLTSTRTAPLDRLARSLRTGSAAAGSGAATGAGAGATSATATGSTGAGGSGAGSAATTGAAAGALATLAGGGEALPSTSPIDAQMKSKRLFAFTKSSSGRSRYRDATKD